MTFRELIALEDEEFVDAAYRALLKRERASGDTALLDSLRQGARKTAILCTLRDSDEGRAASARVPGLRLHAALESARNATVVGPFAALLLDTLNFPGLTHRIVANDRFMRLSSRQLEANLSEHSKILAKMLAEIRETLARAEAARVTADRFETMEQTIAKLANDNVHLHEAVAKVENSVATMSIEIVGLVDVKHQRLQAQLIDLSEELARIRRSLDARPE